MLAARGLDHDRTENSCTVITSRCPIQSLRKRFYGFVLDNRRQLQCTRFPSCHDPGSPPHCCHLSVRFALQLPHTRTSFSWIFSSLSVGRRQCEWARAGAGVGALQPPPPPSPVSEMLNFSGKTYSGANILKGSQDLACRLLSLMLVLSKLNGVKVK